MLKEIIRERFSGEIIYFPNWADENIENYKPKLSNDFNRKKFTITYAGNIGEAQNFGGLIKTIKEMQEKVNWLFIGDGRFKNKFISLIESNNLNNCVKFHKHVSISEITRFLSDSDCLFLSLDDKSIFSKTVPAKLQTYMAMGKPILGVLKGEGANVIKNSNCGFVEENANYHNLSKMIKKMISLNDNQLKNLGKNGRDFYETNFSREKRKNQLLKLFN